jgi:ketosteroid isomerase-like protein
MSQESTTPDLVERWRQAAEAADRRDFDTTMGIFAPDAVWEVQPLGISLESAPAIRSFLEDWFRSYEDYEYDQEEGHNLGNGVVFVVVRLTGHPVGSPGSALMRRRPVVFIWVGGSVARVTTYADSIDEGRAAAEHLAESRG